MDEERSHAYAELVIHHVGVEVEPGDIERSIVFWELLGFQRRSAARRRSPAFTWLERGGTQIHLLPTEGPIVPLQGHVAVVAPDFDAAYAAIEGAGFEIERRGEHWGAARAKATAPGRPRRRADGGPAGARRVDGYDAPVRYPVEQFTPEERDLLAPHFTNLDRPVFALVNLPETVKGALFARYSRYSGTVRRLYLEEFAADAPAAGRPFDAEEGERAAKLYERVFLGYGDDSIAQVGGAHIACEWVSNILTKVLQRGRLAAYLEQSTRYIPYDKPLPEDAGGGYRYYRDERLGPEFGAAMDEVFSIYSRSLERVEAWAADRWPRGADEPEGPWQRSIRAKALDLLRGLLPAATLSHVGIYASGQAYEQLIMRLMASPLPGGARVRRDDPRGAAAGDAELRLAGRPPRSRRRVDLLPGAAPARRPRSGSRGSASTAAAAAPPPPRSS